MDPDRVRWFGNHPRMSTDVEVNTVNSTKEKIMSKKRSPKNNPRGHAVTSVPGELQNKPTALGPIPLTGNAGLLPRGLCYGELVHSEIVTKSGGLNLTFRLTEPAYTRTELSFSPHVTEDFLREIMAFCKAVLRGPRPQGIRCRLMIDEKTGDDGVRYSYITSVTLVDGGDLVEWNSISQQARCLSVTDSTTTDVNATDRLSIDPSAKATLAVTEGKAL
jgi:hypothetical protein